MEELTGFFADQWVGISALFIIIVFLLKVMFSSEGEEIDTLGETQDESESDWKRK